VARELERSAARAQGRGGVAAAAAFLQRSAELTPDPAQRGARALAAARAKFAAAAPDAAYELLAMAELGRLDELQRAELARLRAQMALAERRGGDASQLLLDAAKKLGRLNSGLARETYLEALGAAISAGRLGRGLTVRQAAEAARTAAPSAPQPPGPLDLLLDGAATRLTEGYAAGVPPLRRALDALGRHGGGSEAGIMGWLPLAAIAPELWDDATWHELTTRAVGLAREAGALAVLPVALTYRAAVDVHEGELGAAAGMIEEANAITAATGSASLGYISMILAAWRGEEARALELIEALVRGATAWGGARVLGLAWYATAVLHNGLGGYEAALAGAQRACEYEDLGFFGWSLAELVEAGARSGASDEASAALRQLSERTRAAGSQWALGIEARSRALLSEGPAADTCTGRRSTASGAAASPSISPAPTCCTVNGCAASSGDWKHAGTCGPPTTCSAGSEPRHSPNGPAGSSRRQARQCASAPWTRARPLPCRRRRSPGSLRRATPTLRSAPSCSSAPAPRSTTCARCSSSSASAPAVSSGIAWPNPNGDFDRCERRSAGATLRADRS
jgi:hypothetical protein